MHIERLDHLVLTVSNIEKTVEYYHQVLGMQKQTFAQGRVALSFGQQKINLHQRHREFEPKAGTVQCGSADLCFITKTPIAQVITHLKKCDVAVIEGPVSRTGALGPIVSVYFRDPDQNLIEVSNYL